MKRRFFTCISLILVLTLLVNMLPMGVFAQELRQSISTETVSDTQETVATTDTKIVEEIEEKRTEFSKEFLMNNGLHMAAVYPEAVHYEKDGAWEEIDNTLTAKEDGTYANTAGVWDVRFPQQLTGSNSVTIEKDGYTLSFAMAGELRSTGLEIAAVPEEPEVLAESVLQAVTETVPETTAEVLEETIPETTDDTVPETTAETVPETTTALPDETVPETTAETIPETTAETVPETTAAVTQETLSESTQQAEITEPFALTQMQNATAAVQQIDQAALRESYEHPEMAPDKLRSRLSYADVYQNTNIVYDLDSNQVKESIVMETYSNTLRGYRYTLNVGQMVPVLGDDGQITLYAPDEKTVVMVMPAPYLVDSADAYNSDIQVQLNGGGSRYTLTYLLPTQWLAAQDRAYPVILDPVVTAAMYRANIRDVTIAPGVTPNNNLSKTQVGYSSGYTPAHIYLKYANLPKLTSSDIIINAAVYLTSTGEGSSGDTLVEVRKVNGTWESENITAANTPGYADTVEDYAVINSAKQYHWTITDLVQEWYSGENTGMMFKASNAIESAGVTNYKKFYSSDHSTEGNKPILAIVYRNNNGLESYWDYTATSAGRAGTGYINNFTGNLVWVRNAMGFGGNLMPVNIQLIYNANDVIAPDDEEREYPGYTFDNWFGLGSGWRTNYNQFIKIYGNYYIWEDSDGTKHYFSRQSDGSYKDEDGLELTLTVSGSGIKTHCLKDKNDNCSYFDANGRLSKIENNQDRESSIDITYQSVESNLITKITDGAGRVYSFTYNEGLLTRMSYLGADNTERDFMTFEYEHCLLIFMHDKENHVSYYDYNYNGQLCHIEDRNYMLSYSHTVTSSNKNWQPSRVSRVSMLYGGEDGGHLDIDYAHNQTTFTDHEDRVEIHQFNDFGNTISIQDDEGRAQYSQYALNTDEAKNNNTDATKKTNQLRLSSKLQNTVGNALRDSSFESSTNWVANNANITLSRTTDEKYMGNYSLKLENTGTATYAGYAPNFTVAAGETYTYSAYVKTDTAVAKLALHSPTVPFEILGPEIPEDTDWTRVEMSYTNTTGQAIGLCVCLYLTTAGTAYLDCVQAERAVTASRYNLVENGDFRYSSNWTANGNANGSHAIVTDSSAASELDTSVYRIVGDPTMVKSISQIVPVSGSKDDVYVLAGWAKGDSAPLTSAETDSKIRRFCLKAIFNNTDGTTTERVVSFNPDSNSINSWQYVASPVIADKAYSSILVAAVYDYNVNTVLFDGIQLYKEQFGNSYTYDDKGNVLSVTDMEGQITTYEYTDNDLTKIMLNGKRKMTYTYDDWHNVKTAKTGKGLTYSFTYDTYGNNIAVSITENGETLESTAVYSDSKNYLKSTTDTAGNITEYLYDENTGVLTSVKYPKDTDATKTTYTYDDMFRMKSSVCTTDTGKNLSAAYSYSANDLLTAIETPSTEYSFTYDDFDLRTSVKAGLYRLAEYTYTEDANRYLSALDYGNGDSVEYTYDDKGRLESQRYKKDSTVTDTVSYTYDNNGNLGTMTDSATGITTTYHYDLSNRLCKYTQTGEDYSRVVVYTYDSDNNLEEVSDTINGEEYTTSYAYNSDNVMTGKLHNYGFRLAETSLDEFGRPSSLYGMTLDTASPIRDYTYYGSDSTSAGRVETFRQRSSSSEEDAAYDVTYTYTYDANGNITSVNEDGYFTIYYTYDSANQLIKERHPTAGYVYTWTYDDAGNITSRTEEDRLNDTVRTVNYSYEDDGWGDRLTNYDGKRIDSDAIGNIEYDGTWSYNWEHGRQLKSMSDGTTTWNYTYDANGLRIGRSNGTTTYSYLYGAEGLHSMTVGDETYIFRYDTLGNPLSMYNTATGDIYYYAVNLQGDVVGIITEDERCIVTYRYDAWGNHFQISGSGKDTIGAINPLRYRGYVYDVETGLYYLQSRYYNPELGRFISADAFTSTGQGLLSNNMFAYCGNNPVKNIDPSGTCYYGANGNWCHDNWEYLGGYERKPDPGYYVGTTPGELDIYVATHANYSTPPGAVKIIDKRNAVDEKGKPNPNFQILNSYKITERARQVEVLDRLVAYDFNYPSEHKWSRTQTSLIVEWDAHNMFAMFDQSARDVDFDNNEQGCGYLYFCGKAVVRGWKKYISPIFK